MTFKPGDRAKAGLSDVTIIGVASNGMYACEYDNGAVGFLNPSDLMPPEPEQVVRWVHLWDDGDLTTDTEMGAHFRGVIARARVVLKPGQFDDENTPDPYTKGWNEALEAASNALNDAVMYERDRTEAGQAIRVLKRSAP